MNMAITGVTIMPKHKPRDPKTYAAALTEIKIRLGVEYCAEKVGVSIKTVHAWCNPDDKQLPNLRCCEILDRAYQTEGFGKGPIYSVMKERLRVSIPVNVAEPAFELMDVGQRFGELCEKLRESRCTDGPGGHEITPRENMELRTLVKKMRVELDELDQSIELESGNVSKIREAK